MSFILASTPEGELNASLCRMLYEANRAAIAKRRQNRLHDCINRDPDYVNAQHRSRGGFPTRRKADKNKASTKGIAFIKHSDRYKKGIARPGGKRMKTLILHVTRGWKVYA